MNKRYGQIDSPWNDKRGIASQFSDCLYELPISNVQFERLVIPWGGGAYFRIIPSSLFIDEVRESKAELLLLSALLPTTMLNQKEVIDSLKEAGIRAGVKVLVGGAPVAQEWADQIGADGYGADASDAVHVAKKLIGV